MRYQSTSVALWIVVVNTGAPGLMEPGTTSGPATGRRSVNVGLSFGSRRSGAKACGALICRLYAPAGPLTASS